MPLTSVQSPADASHAKRPRSTPAHPTFITTTTDVSSSPSPSLSLASCGRGYRRHDVGSYAHSNFHAQARPHQPTTCWWLYEDLHHHRGQPFRTAAFLAPSLSQPVKSAAHSRVFSVSSCTFSSASTSRRPSRVRVRTHPLLTTPFSTSRTPFFFSSTFTPVWHHAGNSHPQALPPSHTNNNNNNTNDLFTFIGTIVATARSSEQLRENLTDVSDPVIRAVETLSRRQPRQTVADIAATAGISLSSASDEAVKLASLTGASIDVSDAGDLAYRFPSDVRSVLRTRSVRAAAAMFWRRVAPAVFTAARVGFGALLVLSIVITFVALAVLSAASTRDDDNRRGDSRSMSFFGPRLFFGPDIFDIMFYSQRSAARRRYYGGAKENEEGMSFLEAVYSFVFGDGDPNVDFDDRRWRNVAAVIRANRGAVTADQLAPLLDPPPLSSSSSVVDESFMLPALTRFQGRPEVTDDGDIVYVFPQFLTTGSASSSSSSISSSPSVEIVGQRSIAPVVEQQEVLTQASPSQRALVVTLGVINVLGIALLGAKMATVIPMTRDAAQFIGFVRSVYPALCAYAASFVTAPIFRAWRMRGRNKEIKERNRAREERARVLLRFDDEDVRRKMKAAERRALMQNRVGDGQGQSVVYSSDRDAVDQVNMQEELKDDFDRRLNG